MASADDGTQQQLTDATRGFDDLFQNELDNARKIFVDSDSPFHQLGLGVCAFLEAALGMETALLAEAQRCLSLSEAGSKKQLKASKYAKRTTQFPPGTEWELLNSDAVILLGLNHALSESYMGYLQCLYSLNSAHSKFTKLYKTVYPHGLDAYATPATSPPRSNTPSVASSAASSTLSVASTSTTTPSAPASILSRRSGFFSRFTGGASASTPSSLSPSMTSLSLETRVHAERGSVDELILSGTAFGYGLFNLVFSLLPAKIRGVVGFLGFTSDRKLALQALAVSANHTDVHGVFAGLALMTYHGVVLLLSGYQVDEQHILRQYGAIVDKLSSRYPEGSLWILNRAKILRMSYDTQGAIKVLQDGLKPERPHTFAQADGLLIFELAWTLLSQRRYQEAADTFIDMTKVNSWSHGTYYFIAAGCHVSLGNLDKAKELLEQIPALLDKKKIGGKDLPTEVFIKKKLAFYKEKAARLMGSEDDYVSVMKISPAEELAIFWNTHSRIPHDIALAHITELSAFTPPPTIPSPLIPSATAATPSTATTALPTSAPPDLDTPDELAIRALLLGITHRTAGSYGPARAFLADAHAQHAQVKVSTWVAGVALFELAVLALKEAQARTEGEELGEAEKRGVWEGAMKEAEGGLEKALALATQQVDLSSRLDSRIAMLRDEIALKREMLAANAAASA
ncbi:outer membrane protein Iml2/Tetratricopeptide repeat protein 39 [Rhodofomes roseus]|uniref:Outer membrane protein Iml2/Tetratricopeptide repeat protein 39 n=1 Tax=Rhodofomes roseus TaxID=34475 RepID=A0ABQ8KWG8_9APHY|nr:outer membrane protein Iml2/Tetratricopeptide repeat protein 39 [Rhodofomes roseus]KAH9843146.1 outer membrane protein Iml2/Tetratricopeptide repeat protein 39 [Rhodofomes roseus]